jgi:hypothetical protein
MITPAIVIFVVLAIFASFALALGATQLRVKGLYAPGAQQPE